MLGGTPCRTGCLEEDVPLSEEELRLLEQMERALVEEDPKFASTLRGTSLRSVARRRAILAGIVFLGGVALLMVGVTLHWAWGIAGFLVMLGAATLGLAALRGQRPATAQPQAPEAPATDGLTLIQGGRKQRRPKAAKQPRARSHGSFMERMEERWRRRRETGGF
jgi:hypothetical protein